MALPSIEWELFGIFLCATFSAKYHQQKKTPCKHTVVRRYYYLYMQVAIHRNKHSAFTSMQRIFMPALWMNKYLHKIWSDHWTQRIKYSLKWILAHVYQKFMNHTEYLMPSKFLILISSMSDKTNPIAIVFLCVKIQFGNMHYSIIQIFIKCYSCFVLNIYEW